MIHTAFIAILVISLVIASSFAMYLPLCALIKNKQLGLRYAIPFSISVEIMLGYIFYCTGTMKMFPSLYLIFAIIMNIWAYFRLRPFSARKKTNIDPLLAIILFVLTAVLVYTRFYDGLSFAGPGGNDVYNHLYFIKDLFNVGFLSNGYYAPGFHLFMMPIARVIPLNELYRSAGAAIGIVTIISFVLLMKDYLKNKTSLIFLLVLLALPIYNQFTLQTIYFFSSTLTFLYFAAFIGLLSDTNYFHRKLNYCLTATFSVALAITVPYFFITIVPSSIMVFLLVLFFRHKFAIEHRKYLRYLLNLNLIFLLGLIISFGHVFIQSNILHRDSGFPTISVIPFQINGANSVTPEIDGEKATTSNEEIADRLKLPSFIENNTLLKPMIGTGVDLLKIKYIRPANTFLGIGAYLWMIFSLFLIIYAIRKKNLTLLTVASLGIFFGLCTQTGLFEMSTYRGRSGWYLLMLSIFGLTIFADQLHSNKLSKYILISLAAVSVSGFFFPPQFTRPYNDEEYRIVGQIAEKNKLLPITLIANDNQLDIVSNNLTAVALIPENLKHKNSILVMEKKITTDDNMNIEKNDEFKKYNKLFENENFVIYKNFQSN